MARPRKILLFRWGADAGPGASLAPSVGDRWFPSRMERTSPTQNGVAPSWPVAELAPCPILPNPKRCLRSKPRRRSRRWLVLLPLLAMLLGLIWLAPQWLANSAFRDKILSRAIPGFEGRLQIGPVALSWLSPIVVQDVRVTDIGDQPLLQAAALRTEKSLLALLCQPRAPGLIVVDEPRLFLALRRDGSNLEDALAPLLSQPSSGSARSDVQLEIRGGLVEIVQTETGEASRLEQLNVAVNLPGDAAQPVQARLAGRWAASESLAGTLSADAAWDGRSASPRRLGPGAIDVEDRGLAPADAAGPVAAVRAGRPGAGRLD